MTNHYEDEAQVEELRRWWKENWFALAAGLVLGLGVIFGFQAWKAHRDAHRAEASHIFEDLKQALVAKKLDDAEAMVKRLIAEFDSTPYAADAQMQLAQAALAANRLEEARQRLAWVVDFEQHSSVFGKLARLLPANVVGDATDPALGDVARLRLARVLWQMGKSEDAVAQLGASHDATFDPLYDELRGDVLLSRGDRAGARAAYGKALKAATEDAKNRASLQQKLDSLADVAGSGS